MICDSNSPTSTVYPSLPPHSPYHRRSSPPGSPAPKKCCYEHKESYSPNENVFCCCYSCPGSQSTSVIATIGVCCLVLAYTILGAFAFMALEGRLEHDTAVAASKHDPKHDKSTVGVLRAQTVDKLWSITENLNILYRENWTRLAAEEVLEFQEALIRAMKGTNNGQVRNPSSAMFYYHTPHRWSFSSSFLYSLTLITTIGCDITSCLYRHGKNKILSLVQKQPQLQKAATTFLNSNATPKQVAAVGEQLLVATYEGQVKEHLNDLRYKLIIRSAKSTFHLARLPPTQDAARLHSLWTYHQVQKWLGVEKNPTERGWVQSACGLSPKKMEKDPAPQALLKFISCSCKKVVVLRVDAEKQD